MATGSLVNTDYYKDARARADSLYNAYAQGQEAQRAKDIANNNAQRDAALAKSNEGYNASGRQNYINYMQARKNAPNALNAMGIRGGASESSLIRLGTNYNTNVAQNNLARDNAANEINNNYAQMLFDLNKAYDEDLAAKKAAYLERADSEAKAEEQRQLSYFAQAIQGQYKSKKGYEKLIKQLQASDDPQKVAKIMLARQAMNALKGGGGSGGGGGGSRSYGGYSGYTNNNDNNNNNKKKTKSTYDPKKGVNNLKKQVATLHKNYQKKKNSKKISSSYYTGSWRKYV